MLPEFQFQPVAAATDGTGGPEAVRSGYRKPPRHTEFRKAPSGDPGARRRPIRNLAALLSAALDAPATIVEDGKRRRLTKRALIAAQLVDRSARADLRATKLLVDLLQTIALSAPRPGFQPEPVEAAADKAIMALLHRLGLAE
jgi:hypothetical protein